MKLRMDELRRLATEASEQERFDRFLAAAFGGLLASDTTDGRPWSETASGAVDATRALVKARAEYLELNSTAVASALLPTPPPSA